jgi:hypothetical protein
VAACHPLMLYASNHRLVLSSPCSHCMYCGMCSGRGSWVMGGRSIWERQWAQTAQDTSCSSRLVLLPPFFLPHASFQDNTLQAFQH